MTLKARSFSIFRRRWHATSRSLSEEPTKSPRGLPCPEHPLFFGQRIELSGYLVVSAPLGHHFAHDESRFSLISTTIVDIALLSRIPQAEIYGAMGGGSGAFGHLKAICTL